MSQCWSTLFCKTQRHISILATFVAKTVLLCLTINIKCGAQTRPLYTRVVPGAPMIHGGYDTPQRPPQIVGLMPRQLPGFQVALFVMPLILPCKPYHLLMWKPRIPISCHYGALFYVGLGVALVEQQLQHITDCRRRGELGLHWVFRRRRCTLAWCSTHRGIQAPTSISSTTLSHSNSS